MPDCWAQGAVPVDDRRVSSARSQTEEPIPEETTDDLESSKAQITAIKEETEEDVEREENSEKAPEYSEREDIQAEVYDEDDPDKVVEEVLQVKSPTRGKVIEGRKKCDSMKRKRLYKPHTGSLPRVTI